MPNPFPDNFFRPQYLATRYLRLSPDRERVIPRIVIREIVGTDYPVAHVMEYKGFPTKANAVAWQTRELNKLNAKYPGLYVLQRIVEHGIL